MCSYSYDLVNTWMNEWMNEGMNVYPIHTYLYSESNAYNEIRFRIASKSWRKFSSVLHSYGYVQHVQIFHHTIVCHPSRKKNYILSHFRHIIIRYKAILFSWREIQQWSLYNLKLKFILILCSSVDSALITCLTDHFLNKYYISIYL